MNYSISGKPGDGKGMLSCRFILHELKVSNRPIITDMAIEKAPWVSGSESRIGLLHYLALNNRGRTFDAAERIFRITDSAAPNFFLYRAMSSRHIKTLGDKHLQGYREVTPDDKVLHPDDWRFHNDWKLFVADHKLKDLKDGKQCVVEWDTRLAIASGGHYINMDECWIKWPARGWNSTAAGILFYCSMVRRFGDDCFFQSQRIADVDSILMDRCQKFLVCRNHSRLQFGAFQQFPIFSVAAYDHKPTPSSDAMSRKFYRIDKKGIGQCYDTSGGVNVAGGVLADSKRKNSGIPFWLLPIVALLCLALVVYVFKKAPHYIFSFFHHPASKSVQQVALSGQRTNSPAQTEDSLRDSAQQQAVLPKSNSENTDTNVVLCTGYVYFPNRIIVQLSDGRTADSLYGEVQAINPRRVTVFGQTFQVQHLLNSQIAYSPAPSMYQPDYSQLQTDNQQSWQQSQPVTVIGQNWKSRNTASPVNGFGNSTIANRMGQSAGGTVQQGSYP
ncbi:MAG TPA: hypothetical protein VHG71_06655 [Verrucomicrobiae bacterium]|nr:hypothetical protein [Verrucomicrobiae bacterium]